MAKSLSTERILLLLKSKGALTAQVLAEQLSMTSMGARQHLHTLEEQELVKHFEQAESRGRPKKYWQLTEKANQHFPDRHNDLAINLLESVRDVFGEQGLEQLISEREKKSLSLYQRRLEAIDDVREKVKELASIRTEEGYMASVEERDGELFLLENHCPICHAASACLNFCRSELTIFQTLLGTDFQIERTEHILDGARRCAYRITKR